jgi:hypothetical protein
MQAALLSVGGSLYPPPGEQEPFGGTARPVTEGPIEFDEGGIHGSLTSKFWLNDMTSPWFVGPGLDNGVTFTYILSNFSDSSDSITRLVLNSFSDGVNASGDPVAFETDVSFRIPARTTFIRPSLADRLSADAVGFSFLPEIVPGALGTLDPGETSVFMVVQTNASVAALTTAFVINGSSVGVSSWGPQAGALTVPEPGSFCLAAIGFVGLLSFAFRRHRRRVAA